MEISDGVMPPPTCYAHKPSPSSLCRQVHCAMTYLWWPWETDSRTWKNVVLIRCRLWRQAVHE